MIFPGRMCRIPENPSPVQERPHGGGSETAHTKESGTRSFIASLFILGMGFGPVKARAVNRQALTFWRCCWLLPSLIEFHRLYR
jgi:hypothetical protein